MNCEYCNERAATLRIETTDLVTGRKNKIEVCDTCTPDVIIERQGHQSIFDKKSHQRPGNW